MPRRMHALRGEGPLIEFARELRALQTRSGGTVAETELYGASRTAVYAALAGKRLPSPETLDAIISAWGGGVRWRSLRQQTEEALAEETRLRGEVQVRKTAEEEMFRLELARVWESAGSPSRNVWGREAGLSPRTVGAYLDGKTLPTLAKFTQLIEGLRFLCPPYDEELQDWIFRQGETMREEHLHQARVAQRVARDEARVLAKALPGGQPG
ncbi:hypothetical protein ACFVZZ_26045 [Streptomyces chartreusis]|uniref:hypothetical protein n=1 Tax=Streptomyces chartreusis TaxID=1969 RepID=UPI0036DB7C18